MTARSIRWLRWTARIRGQNDTSTQVHAFVVDNGGRVTKSLCKKKAPRDATVVEFVLSPSDRCGNCDEALRYKGRRTPRAKAVRKTDYRPRMKFEDWDRGFVDMRLLWLPLGGLAGWEAYQAIERMHWALSGWLALTIAWIGHEMRRTT